MKDKISWKEILWLNYRAFLVFYKQYPQMMLSRIICVIWMALTPYISIYLSALLIEELAGERNAQKLKELVIITLISTVGISLVSAFLSKWRDIQNAGAWLKLEEIVAKKLFQMDFVRIDDAKMHELLSLIRQNQNGGWGIYRVIDHCEEMTSAILTLFGGITLTISLFTSKVPENAGVYVVLNQPLFIVLVVVVMLLVTYIAPMLSNKAGSYWAKNADSHRFGNRLFRYFGYLGHKNELAMDMRIYRQDLICDKYNQNKEGTFCSKGPFAKYAVGPVGLYRAGSALVSVVFTGVVYVFVCLKAWAGAFGVGAVTQYIASISKVSKSVSTLISQIGDMRNNAPFLAKVFEFLDIPNTMYQGSLTVEKRRDREYEIEFRNVSFKYPNSEMYALKNVNMKFKVGSRLAVVGMNGSGKTTIIKLLCRLYDPTEGKILVNGIDIQKYNYEEYMKLFSVVFQDFRLFSFSLGENVGSMVDYDRKKVEMALEKAGFGERLKYFDNSFDTILYKDFDENGIEISGGEAQKIALARALYKDAPLMILDEPTAALDPLAEAEVYRKFKEITNQKTAVYISHRLSSCRFCDVILVMDNGKLVQQGTHEELVSDKGRRYEQLWNAQAQYYT